MELDAKIWNSYVYNIVQRSEIKTRIDFISYTSLEIAEHCIRVAGLAIYRRLCFLIWIRVVSLATSNMRKIENIQLINKNHI